MIKAKSDNQNESIVTMPQNPVSTRDESEHLVYQNEVLVEEPEQFEYLEPSKLEDILDPSVGAYKLPSNKSRLEAFIKKIAVDIDYR